jgi:molybdopterin/thiamine biosynthesis adenylyltransferase
MPVAAELTDAQFHRYARHLVLDEIGEEGQLRLLAAKVLVVGAGGLGAPILLYLAASGVGTIGIVDDDTVDLSNLQRQVVHGMAGLGRTKVESAAGTLAGIDPEIRVARHETRLTAENVDEILSGYDIVADGSDNFTTRYLLSDACVRGGKTLVSASLLRFEGQVSVFKPHAGPEHPCYRCLFPEPPPPDAVPRCVEAGILGVTAGVVGTLQATEVVKEILGLGESLSGRLLIYDALATSFYTIRVPRDPQCPSCGEGEG